LKNWAGESQDLDGIEEAVSSDPHLRTSGVQPRAERQVSLGPPASYVRADVPLVSLGAPADPALLEPTYAYLSSYCFACFSPRVAQSLNVAIYELYANALRYGTSRGEVRLVIRRESGRISLSVQNFAEPSHIERLKAQIGRVTADSGAAFGAEMERFASGSGAPTMLGIVRVAHEAGLPLELRCEGERVEISTRCDS
jgi:hypothetical protein